MASSYRTILLLILCTIIYFGCNIEYFDNIIKMSSDELNKNRGSLGNANCHKCGRRKDIHDCISYHKKERSIEDSMSYYNDKFIEMKNDCYNCLTDDISLVSNFSEYPY